MEHDNIVNNNYKLLKSCLYASKIRFPRCYVYMYPFYMLILYFKIYQRSRNYKLKYCPNKVFKNLLELHRSQCRDVNNMIIVNNKQIKKEETFGKLFYRQHNKLYQRIVFIYNNDVCKQQELISNCTMKWNLFNARKDSTRFHLIESEEIIVRLKILEKDEVKFANEIELCLINNPNEITEGILDTLIKNYFSSPKIVYKNDIIEINIKLFAPEIYYAKQKPNFAKSVFLKCTKLFYQNKAEASGLFCVLNVTTFKQSSNIQGFLPQRCQTGIKNFSPNNDILNWNIDFCPSGLISYAKLVERSIKPFLGHGQLDGLNPIFLIQGQKGIGKHRLISSISKKFGFHFYRVTNYDVTANIYAQNETKLRNIFFNAKISSPCIIYLQNFENFGKNNDGQFDERITSNFQQQVNELFQRNTFPILIFCSSNEKITPTELKRTFLETFEIKAPNDLGRKQHLEWIIKYFNLKTTVNLDDIAQKTHGFLFEDFKALVNYAKQNAMKSCSDPKNVELCEEDFEVALDYMKANYNESLGAPKVPKVNWSDIGGLTDVKEEIIKTINLTLKHPELMKTSGLKRSGILLFGPPGTGKTLIAKAVATECNLCFLSVKGPELLNMYIGQSEENVREVFERARQASPCVIFFDELDSLAPNRGMSGDSGGVMDRVVSQLLAEMDGLNKNGTIFIIGATNRPDLIDPSLLRPGRFDKLLYVGPCTDYESKLSVFKALTRKFKLSKDVNLETIIKTCPNNITGADFYGICSNAWASAVRRIIQDVEKGKRSKENLTSKLIVVKSSDFSHAIENVKLSISPEEMQYFNNLKKELSAKK